MNPSLHQRQLRFESLESRCLMAGGSFADVPGNLAWQPPPGHPQPTHPAEERPPFTGSLQRSPASPRQAFSVHNDHSPLSLSSPLQNVLQGRDKLHGGQHDPMGVPSHPPSLACCQPLFSNGNPDSNPIGLQHSVTAAQSLQTRPTQSIASDVNRPTNRPVSPRSDSIIDVGSSSRGVTVQLADPGILLQPASVAPSIVVTTEKERSSLLPHVFTENEWNNQADRTTASEEAIFDSDVASQYALEVYDEYYRDWLPLEGHWRTDSEEPIDWSSPRSVADTAMGKGDRHSVMQAAEDAWQLDTETLAWLDDLSQQLAQASPAASPPELSEVEISSEERLRKESFGNETGFIELVFHSTSPSSSAPLGAVNAIHLKSVLGTFQLLEWLDPADPSTVSLSAEINAAVLLALAGDGLEPSAHTQPGTSGGRSHWALYSSTALLSTASVFYHWRSRNRSQINADVQEDGETVD